MWLRDEPSQLYFCHRIVLDQHTNLRYCVRAVIDGFDSGEKKIGNYGYPQMSFHGILRTSKQVLDCQILLYEFEERLHVPPVAVEISNLQAIEFQAIGNVRDKRELLSGLQIAELNQA